MAALVVVCVGLLAHADPYWVVAERGKPATCAICVSDANNPVQCFAAEELRDHVRGMTDVNLPIVNAVPQGRAIVLSSDVFDDDGFSLKVTGDRLEVKGGRGAGVLFGVYELLETYGGCGWFSADSVDIPRLSAFRVPEGLDDRQKPAFCLRSTSWSPVIGSSSVVHAARCRLNGSRNTGGEARFGGSNPYRFDKVLDNCHTFRLLVPVMHGMILGCLSRLLAIRFGRRQVGDVRTADLPMAISTLISLNFPLLTRGGLDLNAPRLIMLIR